MSSQHPGALLLHTPTMAAPRIPEPYPLRRLTRQSTRRNGNSAFDPVSVLDVLQLGTQEDPIVVDTPDRPVDDTMSDDGNESDISTVVETRDASRRLFSPLPLLNDVLRNQNKKEDFIEEILTTSECCETVSDEYDEIMKLAEAEFEDSEFRVYLIWRRLEAVVNDLEVLCEHTRAIKNEWMKNHVEADLAEKYKKHKDYKTTVVVAKDDTNSDDSSVDY